jgi:hypothetical protein
MTPQPWLLGVKRRGVEKDYNYYDPPETIWHKINSHSLAYKTREEFYQVRDKAYCSLMYLSTCRSSELCRANLEAGYKPSVMTHQFELGNDFLNFRDVIVLKRRIIVGKDNTGRPIFGKILDIEEYPKRTEIKLPLQGRLNVFTEAVQDYLELLDDFSELFPFMYRRGWQIVNGITGETQHYLRAMGLKLYSRLVGQNLKDLQDFSGHKRLESLVKYLGEGRLEERLLNY